LTKKFAEEKECIKFAPAITVLVYGVTGNTSGFGPEEINLKELV